MTQRWSPDFLDLLTALNAAEARFLLVGGHAVGLYARPRATKDFDLWVEASPDNARRVWKALQDFGAPLAGVAEADFAAPGSGFRMGSPPFRLELLTEISAVPFEAAWSRKQTFVLDEVPCHVIAIADLVANKRAAGRPQDLADVVALERASRPK